MVKANHALSNSAQDSCRFSYTVQQWQQSETKSGGLKIKLEIPFFLLPPQSPSPQISNKRRPLFLRHRQHLECLDGANWQLTFVLPPPPHLPRNSFWIPRMQSLMVLTTKTTDRHICTPHRVPFHRGGGGGEGMQIKKWNVLIQPHQPATYVASCFKQMSQHLLELPKMPLPLFVCACEHLGDCNTVDCVSQCLVTVDKHTAF